MEQILRDTIVIGHPVGGNISLQGNVHIGNAITRSKLETLDPLVEFGSSNTGSFPSGPDIGFYGQYGSTATYTGLVRDTSDPSGTWNLFDTVKTDPSGSTTISVTQDKLACLRLNTLDASGHIILQSLGAKPPGDNILYNQGGPLHFGQNSVGGMSGKVEGTNFAGSMLADWRL